jgi:hypothetical protein
VGCVAALAVVVLSGATLDYRFFSLPELLPFVFIALLRRATDADPRTS